MIEFLNKLDGKFKFKNNLNIFLILIHYLSTKWAIANHNKVNDLLID